MPRYCTDSGRLAKELARESETALGELGRFVSFETFRRHLLDLVSAARSFDLQAHAAGELLYAFARNG